MKVPPRICAHCAVEFPYNPAHPNQTYCKTACRLAAKETRRARTNEDKSAARVQAQEDYRTKFVAVDGEGVDVWRLEEVWDEESAEMVMTRVKRHEYVLISVGDQSYHNDGKMLTHEEVFRFLYEQKRANPDAAFVGFFLGYDFSQWLKTLPESRAYSLLHPDGIAKRKPQSAYMKFPFPVYARGWELDILGMKRFKLRPYVKRDEWPQCTKAHKSAEQIELCAMGKHNKHPNDWMYVCDAGAFFQMSFMRAITEKWKPGTEIVTPEEIAVLKEGKDNRATAKFDPAMIRYNVLENDVLARLMETVNEGFLADGIKLNRNQWFGPGQAAQAWMRLIGLPRGDEVRASICESLGECAGDDCKHNTIPVEAARQSYYGGWFEIMMHGPVTGETFSYDINSAYPYAIANLPCLLHGKWTMGEGKPPRLPAGSYQLVDARVSGRDKYIGAMPHRDSSGRILRPAKTSGWYWQHELDAAKKAGVVDRIGVDRWVRYDPCPCPKPAAAIADLYTSRLEVGKNSPFGKSKKLVYNSAYGKFAQSVGQPRYSNSLYASLITSHCRTMILEAIATHPEKTKAVAMVATDSVTFLTPHPTLPLNEDELGKWDQSVYTNLSLMMPGLYWDDSSRAAVAKGKTPTLKSRGVSAGDLSKFIDRIDRQWSRLINRDSFDPDQAPAIDINVAFSVISPKLAIHRNDWSQCGEVRWNENRTLSANPIGKRLSFYTSNEYDRRVIRSVVWPEVPGENRTSPYSKTFGAEIEDEAHILEEWLTPDGTVASEIAGLIPRG